MRGSPLSKVSMGHKHNHNCQHPSVKFCSHCQKVYCEGCDREWGPTSLWNYSYYPYSLYPSYQTGYLRQDGIYNGQGGIQGQVPMSNLNTLKDGHEVTVTTTAASNCTHSH